MEDSGGAESGGGAVRSALHRRIGDGGSAGVHVGGGGLAAMGRGLNLEFGGKTN